MMQKKFIVFPRLRSSWAGAWLSGKVLAWRAQGPGFNPLGLKKKDEKEIKEGKEGGGKEERG